MRNRAAVLLASVLTTAAAVLALPAPASAVVEGIDVTITEVPDEFRAGADARTVEVVASTANRGACRKVRWSMVLTVDGVDLDQVRVARVEQDDSFPLRVRADGDTARLTDVRLDPGSLCRNRTVTARYRVAFDDDAPAGRVTFQAQAFDAATRLLQEATAISRVVGAGDDDGDDEASPSPSPSPSEPAAEESPAATEEPSDEAAAPPADDVAARPAAGPGGAPGLLGPGLIIGAALVFAGVGLLLRIRMRNRQPQRHTGPATFHPTR